MSDNTIYHRFKLLDLRAILLVFLLAFSSMFTSPSWAQNQPEVVVQENESSYDSLAKLLSNDTVRQKLIEQLHQIALEENIVLDNEEVRSEPPALEKSESIASHWRQALQLFTNNMVADLKNSWGILFSLIKSDSKQFEQISIWKSALFSLFLTIFATSVAFLLLRRVAKPLFKGLSSWARRIPSDDELLAIQRKIEKRELARSHFFHLKHQKQTDKEEGFSPAGQAIEVESVGLHADMPHEEALRRFSARYTKLRKLAAVVTAAVVDVVVIFLAVFVGYLGLIGVSTIGFVSASTALSMQFLTAFTAIELVKVLGRCVFSAHYPTLRLLPINSESASFWNHWTALILSVVGYGLLVLVPVLQTVFSASLANVVGAFLITVVYIYAISVLWSKRKSVSAAFIAQAEKTDNAMMGMVLRVSAKVWLWLAFAYFTVLLVVTHIDKQNALSFMAQASLKTILSVLVGSFLSLLLATLSTHRIHLSAQWHHELPLLEERLNSYVPTAFRFLSIIVLVGVLLFVFDAWRLFDLQQWIISPKGQSVINTTIRVIVVLVIAAFSWIMLASMIEHRLASAGEKMPSEREKTLLMLFRNALAIIIVTLTALTILSQVGIDIAPLIAGAGVVGLAVGFGAQKLVQDVITGIFIQLENGMNQNDVVEVAGLFGVVEKMTIRSVVIRTLDGGYHLVPFSSIDCVANHTRDYGYHHGEYLVSLRESVDDVMQHLRAAFADLKEDPTVKDAILDEISIPGVTSLGREGATIRVLIKTAPGMQWAVQRSFNRLVKQHFDAAGIEIPYPQTVIHFGRDKDGNAAPVDIKMVDALAQSVRAE